MSNFLRSLKNIVIGYAFTELELSLMKSFQDGRTCRITKDRIIGWVYDPYSEDNLQFMNFWELSNVTETRITKTKKKQRRARNVRPSNNKQTLLDTDDLAFCTDLFKLTNSQAWYMGAIFQCLLNTTMHWLPNDKIDPALYPNLARPKLMIDDLKSMTASDLEEKLIRLADYTQTGVTCVPLEYYSWRHRPRHGECRNMYNYYDCVRCLACNICVCNIQVGKMNLYRSIVNFRYHNRFTCPNCNWIAINGW